MDCLAEALDRLRRLLSEAQRRHVPDANAAALATADAQGRPSVRTINIMLGDAGELVFFTHRESGKAHQLNANPYAGVVFYWPILATQVAIDAESTEAAPDLAEDCWYKRPHESQLAAWVSRQSTPTGERRLAASRVVERREAFDFQRVPMPPDWCAYQLLPRRIEFWQGGWQRLQTRIRFMRSADGNWTRERYEP